MKVFIRSLRQFPWTTYTLRDLRHCSFTARAFSVFHHKNAEKRLPNPFLKPTTEIRNDGGDHEELEDREMKEEIAAWLRERSPIKHGAEYDVSFPLDNVRNIASVVEFESLAAQGKAGAPEAMLLLARSQRDMEDLPLEEQRTIAGQVGAGRILEWILKTDHRYWDTILPRDLIRLLCWHLEAEGLSGSVVNWVNAWYTNPDMRHGAVKAFNPYHKDDRIRWPERMAVAILEAKLYWAADGTANDALEYVLSMFDGPIGQSADTRTVTIPLRAHLWHDQSRPCSARLYDEYIAAVQTGKVKRDFSEERDLPYRIDQGTVMLYHPTEATGEPLLLVWKGMKTREREAAQRWSDKYRWDMANQLMRAAYLLRLEGRATDAIFLEEISQDLHPKPWSLRRRLYTVWRQDRRLVDIHLRSPYARELAAFNAMRGGSWSSQQD